jgi:hypothetical protein
MRRRPYCPRCASKATNVRLRFDYTGTLEGSKAVAAGKAAGKYDAIWFSSNRYLSLIPDASKRIAASTKIMASPVRRQRATHSTSVETKTCGQVSLTGARIIGLLLRSAARA